MSDALQQAFGWICGQHADHTWAPGGLLLPFCQRCTGLYVGAVVSALLHLALRPAATPRWLAVHGAFLLVMAPFGFHWLPQEAWIRTGTGVLFGFGLVAFLRLPFDHGAPRPDAGRSGGWLYGAFLVATLLAVPWLGGHGNALAAATLTWAAVAGALVLATLSAASLARAAHWLAAGMLPRLRPGR